MAGFEPTTSCSQSRRSTKLSYIPQVSDERFELPKAMPIDLQSTPFVHLGNHSSRTDRVGFEPTDDFLSRRRFSKPLPLAARPSVQRSPWTTRSSNPQTSTMQTWRSPN